MKFYSVMTDEGKRKKFAYGIPLNDIQEQINCPSCGREWLKSTLLDADVPLTLVLSNCNFPDFLGVIYHQLILDKVKYLFEQEEVTGYYLVESLIISANNLSPDQLKYLRVDYSTSEIKKSATDPPDYFRLFVNGSAELHDISELILADKCDNCGYVEYRTPGTSYVNPSHPIYLKTDSWDGKDLFKVKELPGRIFCSERFKEIYERHKLSGLIFNNIESL